jgi:GH15 family glucan-1,4-alpha-glucosidase
MSDRIEGYALIGDGETAAHVSTNGWVDCLCWPRFSSTANFAALLDDASQGRWQIAPVASEDSANMPLTRRYLHDTLTLESDFVTTPGSAAVLIVFMPLCSENAAEMRSSRFFVKPAAQAIGRAR